MDPIKEEIDMKKIIGKIFKNICIAYLSVSLFMIIAVIFETKHEMKELANNEQVEQMPLASTIDEQIKIYNENINDSQTDSYAKLLSSLGLFTIVIPFCSLIAAVVSVLVYEITIALFDKSSADKLNEQLRKHK